MKLRHHRRAVLRRMEADATRRSIQHAADRVTRSVLDAFEAGAGITRAYVEAYKREMVGLLYRQVVRPVVLKLARGVVGAGPFVGGAGGQLSALMPSTLDSSFGSSATL